MEVIRSKVGFKNCFVVPSKGKSGGLAVLWHDYVNIKVCNYSFFHVDFLVEGTPKLRFTLFYGSPVSTSRHRSWDLLRKLNKLSDLPWCIFGDFNEVLRSSEVSRLYSSRLRQIDCFRSAVKECKLYDLKYKGGSNHRKGDAETRSRLDRTQGQDSFGSKECGQGMTIIRKQCATHGQLYKDKEDIWLKN
ncbi:hypothetical protein QQ045_006691 [Rhodiola kirilowii]